MTLSRPLFVADWLNAMFIHLRVDRSILQAALPMELDTFDGDAYVSLVAFTQDRLRPRIGGRISALLSRPLARHPFFNLRTYVRHGGARGIFFLAEWIPNRLAALIGPRTYGLPYRLGRLSGAPGGGRVDAQEGGFEFRRSTTSREFRPVTSDSLDHFLLERYTAFTHRNGITRRFDVAHEPWPQASVNLELGDTSLLENFKWMRTGEFLSTGHYSPGVFDVGISPPRVVAPDACHSRLACSTSCRRKM